jgi:hypothetical protein
VRVRDSSRVLQTVNLCEADKHVRKHVTNHVVLDTSNAKWRFSIQVSMIFSFLLGFRFSMNKFFKFYFVSIPLFSFLFYFSF